MKTNEQENYEKFMKQFIDFYQECLEEYDKEFESFYCYGPLSEQYWINKPRILICNLEPYDEREGVVSVDINLFKEHWMKSDTGIKTARCISGLINSIIQQTTDIKVDFQYNMDEMIKSMSKVAYMNFRISSGENAPVDGKGIFYDVDNFPDYLRKQIELLSPNIIIIGGEIGCIVFKKLFEDCDIKFHKTILWNEKVICSTTHFSRVKYKDFNNTINDIINLYIEK